MQKQHIKLTTSERLELEGLLKDESLSVKVHKKIEGLLLLDSGKTYLEVLRDLGKSHVWVKSLCQKYNSKLEGQSALDYLSDSPRSARPPMIYGLQRAKITALACSPTPEGHAKWTLRLLAARIVELEYCEEISYRHVGNILKKP